MVQEIRYAEKAIGNITYELTEKQKAGKSFSRSLYAVQEIKMGDKFNSENIRSIRPGYGLHPKYLNNLLGTIAKRNINKGNRLNKNDLL
jgi:pseudaminic acid synthase